MKKTWRRYVPSKKDIGPAIRKRREIKFKRDSELLRAHARAVIILDKEGIKEVILREKDHADVVAVLGPADVDGTHFPEALVLEIGLSDTRPYSAATRGSRGHATVIMRKRRQVRPITKDELSTVWQVLGPVFRLVTEDCMKHWKQRSFFIPVRNRMGRGQKFREFQQGIRFHVPRDEHLLVAQLFHEDVSWRGYLIKWSRAISFLLRTFKLNAHAYSDRFYRSNARACEIAGMIASQPPHLVRPIVDRLSRQKRMFVEEIVRVHGIIDVLDRGVGHAKDETVQKLKGSKVRIIRDAGKVRGRNALTFQHVVPDPYDPKEDLEVLQRIPARFSWIYDVPF